MLQLRNPHSVLAALETRPQDISQLIVPRHAPGEAWDRVIQLAKKSDIPIVSGAPGKPESPRGQQGWSRDRDSGRSKSAEGGRAGVAEAMVQERKPISVEELFEGASDKAQGKGLWLALDCLQDPHNVGAIFRTAAFFGVQGVLITQERSAPLTATVYDVASGGMEYVPFTLQTNLQRGFEKAKDAGLWILGASEHAHDDIGSVQRDRPWLLVIGNEEKGMRRLTEDACDVLCRISPRGKVTSLNASVAASILISSLTSPS